MAACRVPARGPLDKKRRNFPNFLDSKRQYGPPQSPIMENGPIRQTCAEPAASVNFLPKRWIMRKKRMKDERGTQSGSGHSENRRRARPGPGKDADRSVRR